MPKGLGRQIQVGFAKEAVRGTAEAAATYYVPFNEAAVEDKIEQAIDDQAQGVIEDASEAKIIGQYADIQLKGAVGDKTFPLLLLATLGAVNTAANPDAAGTVKDHTLTVSQNIQHQSLTVFLNDPLAAQDYKHALGCIDSLELAYEQGNFINFTAKMLAKKGATATLTPATTAENLFLPQHFTLKFASTVAGLTAASAIVIKSAKLSIAKGLEVDKVLGSVEPVDFLANQIVIEGELEAIWQNESDFKTDYLAGTTKAMRIDLKNNDVTIGTAAKPQIVIDFNKVVFSELTRPFKVGDIVKQTLKFKALYNPTDGKAISIKATNLVVSY